MVGRPAAMQRTLPAAAILIAIVAVSACGSTPPQVADILGRAEATDGPFRLEFVVPKSTWRADEQIVGQASLSFAGQGGIDLGGSSGGLIGFGVSEVGGTRHMGVAADAACFSRRLEAGRPMVSGLMKSGGFSGDDPNAAFYRAFFADKGYHLPAGTWEIAAVASFVEGRDCRGASHTITARLRIRVEG